MLLYLVMLHVSHCSLQHHFTEYGLSFCLVISETMGSIHYTEICIVVVLLLLSCGYDTVTLYHHPLCLLVTLPLVVELKCW